MVSSWISSISRIVAKMGSVYPLLWKTKKSFVFARCVDMAQNIIYTESTFNFISHGALRFIDVFVFRGMVLLSVGRYKLGRSYTLNLVQ